MSSRTQPLRGPITDYLLTELVNTLDGVLVGDGVAPDDGGWKGGDIGAGTFAAYVVLTTGVATQVNTPPQGLKDQSGDAWNLTYTLASYGGVRQQADDVADQVRAAWQQIDLLRSVDLGQPWGFQSRQITTYGAVSPEYAGTRVQWWSVSDADLMR